jgi:xanthine dehydrogenase accessory factor
LAAGAPTAPVSDQSGFAGGLVPRRAQPAAAHGVVGAVHIAQALVPMARLAGYDVAVVDPREAFGGRALPRRDGCHDWPDAALTRLRPRQPHRGGDADP